MVLQSDDLKNGEVIESDICVVGAGCAGITFAREFINTNKSVTLLESGGLEIEDYEKLQELNTGVNEPVNQEIERGIPHYKLDEIRARVFGGSSQLWHLPLPSGGEGLRLRAMDKIDFEKRDWVPCSGWPIRKEDLDPYYEKAHKVFKIGPYSYDYDYWKSTKNLPEKVINESDLKTTFFQFGRKEIFYKEYLEELKKAGNIKVILNSTVLNIQLNENGSKTDSVLVSNLQGLKYRVKAKYFILALGGIEIPRLMLLSDDVMRQGVGNQNDLVGRFFMEHPHVETGVFYPSDHSFFESASAYNIHNRDGVPVQGKIRLSDEVICKEKLLNSGAALIHVPMVGLEESEIAARNLASSLKRLKIKSVGKSVGTLLKNLNLVTYIILRKLARGDKDKWYDKKFKYHGYRLSFMFEQIPDPESRVLLDGELDQFGQRKVKLNWKINSEDIRNIRRTQEIMNREVQNHNIGKIEIEMNDDSIPRSVHGGKHHMGTTRMNNDPKKGVVDENCKVHEINNLYIAGSSVFPTGGYVNPTLTISALSLRLADHIKNSS